MKRFLLCLLVPTAFFANNSKSTYESIREQLAQEADVRVQTTLAEFNKEYRLLMIKLGLSSFLTGAFLPLTIQALRNNDTRLACLYSALTTFFGSYTFLKHSELAENRRVLHEEMFIADNIYQNKMGHIHTRHYMNDIAKFIMAGLEQLAEKYASETICLEDGTLPSENNNIKTEETAGE